VGWQYAIHLARHHDVTVLCGDVEREKPTAKEHARFKQVSSLPPGLSIVYVEPSRATQICERIHRLSLMWWMFYVAYNLWQRSALRVARQLVRQDRPDVVHHLNMIGFREPGYLYTLGIPFVLGPLGGANNTPHGYGSACGQENRLTGSLRTVVNEIQKRIAWRPRQAARAARHIWAATPRERAMVTEIWGCEAELFPETGANPQPEFTPRPPLDDAGRLRVLWSGSHCQRKCLPILIDALATPELSSRVVVTVLGEGSETAAWKARAVAKGVADSFVWKGRVTHEEAVRTLASNDVCVLTSTREGTPHVVLEALGAGVPVICHDACGMGLVVDDSCGIKVPLADFQSSVLGFRQALIQLVETPDLIRSKSGRAHARATQFSWAAKAAAISERYRQVVTEATQAADR
jgi:glycosyltransferase involved in cell wall biosynthesis